MKRLLSAAVLAASALALGGCDDDDPARLGLRVIHASPDAPRVNVRVNDNEVLSAVDYKEGSGFIPVDQGSYDIAVDAITPTGTPTVIDVQDTTLLGGRDYTVLAIGKVADDTLEPLVIENVQTAVPSGQARVEVVHASPDAPAVNVYVTAPADPLGSPLGTFSFSGTLGPVEVPAGEYRIRVTPATSTTVVYDSGPVTLPAGADLLVAAVTSAVAGGSPISLLVNDGDSQTELLDTALAGADVRVAHLSPDTPAVDVIVDDDFANPAFDGATFPGVTGYATLPPDTYNFKVVDDATQSLTAIDATLPLASGSYTTVAAVNLFAAVEPLVLTDRRRSIATEAQVRIVHASPSAGAVDIYVTAPAADIATLAPTFANVPFKADTGFVSLAPGDYQVRVTPTGTKTVAIDATATFAAGGIYNAFARDAAGGGTPLGVVLIDELDD
jgi:hypothetical protein